MRLHRTLRCVLFVCLVALVTLNVAQSACAAEPFRISHLEHGQHSDFVLRYPLMYWREWSNQKLPPVRVLFCMLILVSIFQLFFNSTLQTVQGIYDKQRLRSFGVGALTCTGGCLIAGLLYRLELFAPLAGLLLALVQLLELFGLAVASQSIGSSLFNLLKLGQWQTRSKMGHLARIWCGAFLLSLIVLIPRVGALPPIGNRLLCLIAVAGAGATIAFIRRIKIASSV